MHVPDREAVLPRPWVRLTPEDKTRYNTARSVLELSQHVTKLSTSKHIEAKVKETSKALPIGKSIAAIAEIQGTK